MVFTETFSIILILILGLILFFAANRWGKPDGIDRSQKLQVNRSPYFESEDGILTAEQLFKFVIVYNARPDTATDEHIARMAYIEDPAVFDRWLEYLVTRLRVIADQENLNDQLTELQKAIVQEISISCACKPIIQDAFSEEHIRELLHYIFESEQYESMLKNTETIFMFSDITHRSLLGILQEIDETTQSEMYSALYKIDTEKWINDYILIEEDDVLLEVREELEGLGFYSQAKIAIGDT